MKHLAARLACLAIAVTGASAWAQPVVSAARNSGGCSDIVITNNTDHTWVLHIPYQYEGKDTFGRDTVYNSETPYTVYPRSTTRWEAWSANIDCSKNPRFFTLPGRAEDQTAAVDAQRKLYDDSTKQVIANELARQAEVKRLSDANMARQQAEAARRAAQQAEQQAARDRAAQASRDVLKQQQDFQQRSAQATIDGGDPRCRTFGASALDDYYTCKRSMDAQDERDRQAKLADQKQQQLNAEARAIGERRVQQVDSLQSSIDPETCVAPSFAAASELERLRIQQSLDQAVTHCQQLALGRNASAQRQQAAIVAAQEHQQQMIAAQQQAEYQAQQQAALQQQAQQSLSDAAADIRVANDNTLQASSSIQQSNAELEAWLNSH